MRAWAAAAIVGLFAATACTPSSGDPAYTGRGPSRTVEISAAVAGSTARDQRNYFGAVRAGTGHNFTDRSLVVFADLTCSWFAEGADLVWVSQNLSPDVSGGGGNSADIATIVASAVVNMCPKYVSRLRHAG